MGQNKIQAFATDSSANVLTDEALATQSEMQTGFPTGSKANSALVGKLIQNATAGAYAVAEFTAKNSDSDISGSDPTGFATAFENAVKKSAGGGYIKGIISDLVFPENPACGDTYIVSNQDNGFSLYNIVTWDGYEWRTISPFVQVGSNDDGFALNISDAGTRFPIDVTSKYYDVNRAGAGNYINYQDRENNVSQYQINTASSANSTNSGAFITLQFKTENADVTNTITLEAHGSGVGQTGQINLIGKSIKLNGDIAINSGHALTLAKDPEQALEAATKQYVDRSIPDTSTFATKEEVNAKADNSALADYLPIAGGTVNGNLAVVGNTNLSGHLSTTGDVTVGGGLTVDVNQRANLTGGLTVTNSATIDNLAVTGTTTLIGNASLNGNTIATVNQIPNMAAYVKYVGDAEHNEVRLDIFESNNPEGNKNLYIEMMTSTGEVSEAIECAPITNPSFQENAYINGNAIATEVYVDSLTSTKISLTGNRGVLAGYETTTDVSKAITITSSSPDSQRAPTAIAITVPNGSSEESWVKKVLIQDTSSSITLGDQWFWTGGTQPTLTAPSLLVLSWDSVCGIAILNTTA